MTGLLIARHVFAADSLSFAPPEPWVEPLPSPPAVIRDPDRSVGTLLLDEQDRLGHDGVDTFYEAVNLIQNAQGLSDLGSIQFSWNPDTETPIVNRLSIRRGSRTIDILASGQSFSVLRRESNLESAMLDGVLTAALQPEDLQVGDVVDFAFTLKRRDPVLHGHAESLFYWDQRRDLRCHETRVKLCLR